MKKYIVYVLQGLLVFFFIVPGIMKVAGNPALIEVFEGFGYPLWFMYFIGVAEIAGALGIAVGGYVDKRLPRLAVLGLIIIMIGAAASQIIAGNPVTSVIPVVINLILLGTYLYLKRQI